jgi:4-diphosphocytidyl-2-C-methyl-D-erythritol kinase
VAEAPWLPAPAKLNLFLRIVGRREDGYHLLQTVFQLLDWGDTVHIRLREDGRVGREGPAPAYALDMDDDLAIRAAKLLASAVNCGKGADIRIEKRIPAGGGFGGGSSDAATVLVALNHLWRSGLDVESLCRLGLQLGADVPVFVRGSNAWAEGIGEVLTPIELPPAWYLVVDPGVSVPTAALFAAPELTRDAPPATIAGFLSGSVAGNAFEPVLRGRESRVDAVLRALSAHGSACLTGTGSGCFVRFPAREAADAALAALPPGLDAWIAAGTSHSALLDALALAEDPRQESL